MQNIQHQYLNDINEILARNNMFGQTISVKDTPVPKNKSSRIVLDEELACTSLHIDNERILLLETTEDRYVGTIRLSAGNNLLTVFGSHKASSGLLGSPFVSHQVFVNQARENALFNLSRIKKVFTRYNLGPSRPIETEPISPLIIRTTNKKYGFPSGFEYYTIAWQSVVLGGELKDF